MSNFFRQVICRLPMYVYKKFSPFGPTIQLARGIIYKNILFYYYIDYRYTWFNHDYRGRTRILETTLKLLTINFLQKFS